MLATSEFGKDVQGEIDLYITNGRLNEASFRRKFDPILRNIIKNQNPIELLFKDVKHFDAQKPCDWLSNLRSWYWGKKKGLSKFLAKAPDIRDLEIRSGLKKLREKDKCVNKGNDNNNNNNNNNIFLPPPPYPPHPRPPAYVWPPFKTPTLSDFMSDNQAGNFSQQPAYVPPPPPSPLPPVLCLRLKRQSDVGRNTTQTLSGDHLIGEHKRVIEKEKSK